MHITYVILSCLGFIPGLIRLIGPQLLTCCFPPGLQVNVQQSLSHHLGHGSCKLLCMSFQWHMPDDDNCSFVLRNCKLQIL